MSAPAPRPAVRPSLLAPAGTVAVPVQRLPLLRHDLLPLAVATWAVLMTAYAPLALRLAVACAAAWAAVRVARRNARYVRRYEVTAEHLRIVRWTGTTEVPLAALTRVHQWWAADLPSVGLATWRRGRDEPWAGTIADLGEAGPCALHATLSNLYLVVTRAPGEPHLLLSFEVGSPLKAVLITRAVARGAAIQRHLAL